MTTSLATHSTIRTLVATFQEAEANTRTARVSAHGGRAMVLTTSPWLMLAVRCDSESFREAWFHGRVEHGEIEPTQAEVAKVLGCDVSYVGQLERSALAKLAKNRQMRELARQFEEQRGEQDGRAA